jgi:hypothetical protein
MKTEVIMKRELFGNEISQSSKTEFFSATDLVRAGNEWRALNKIQPFKMSDWLQTKQVKEFIAELEKEYGKIIISGKGRGHNTWVHPFLFIDMALAISPKLKLETYKWIYDNLIKYRNNSGDSYKKMAGALYLSISNKSEFKETLIDYAKKIKEACGVEEWQTASEKQLKLRDKIHEYVSVFSDIIREKNNLINVAIKKACEE